jgi:hypothetical protein
MSALDAIFAKGGQPYRPVPDQIDQLPKRLRHAATVAWRAIMKRLARDELDESATDRRLGEEVGWSDSLIQKGLNALDRQMEKIGLKPLIERHRGIGMAGRRQIIPAKLAGSRKRATDDPEGSDPVSEAKDDDAPAVVAVPPVDQGRGAGGATELPPGIAGAVGLVPDLSRECLLGWIAKFGAELAAKGVAWLRIWLSHPDTRKRPQVASWAEAALREWKAKLDLGHITTADIDATIAAKVKRWGPKPKTSQAAADDAATKAREAQEHAREQRLRGLWAALSEGKRQEIRAKVKAENPGIGRWGNMLEPLCLAELERRQAAEEPRAP